MGHPGRKSDSAIPGKSILFLLAAYALFLGAPVLSVGCSAPPPPEPRKDLLSSMWEELPYGTDVNKVMEFLDKRGVRYTFTREGEYFGRRLMTRDAIHVTLRNYKRSEHDISDLKIIFYIDADGELERIWTR